MTLLRTVDPVWLSIFAFVFGACVGSFLNVCIYRLPRGVSIVSPRSQCPRCQGQIRFFDNIPIISFLLLMGRCRHCGTAISLQYPIVELLTAIISLLLFKRFGPTLDYGGYFIFSAALIVVSGIDVAHRVVPDRISLPGILAGLGFSFVTSRITPLDSAVGIAAGGGSLLLVTLGYGGFVKLRERFKGMTHLEETEKALEGLSLEALRKEAAHYGIESADLRDRRALVMAIGEAKREGMGGGDMKLLAMIGSFLGGWRPILFVILFASFLGCVVGVPSMLIKGRDSKYAIPFGPFLGVSAVIYLLWGTEIIGWYFRMGK